MAGSPSQASEWAEQLQVVQRIIRFIEMGDHVQDRPSRLKCQRSGHEGRAGTSASLSNRLAVLIETLDKRVDLP